MDELIPSPKMCDEFPGFSKQYWPQKRHLGGGPRYIKLGRKVFYRRSDVQAWIDSNVMERTDRPVTA